jgi:hypothetical protein
MLAAFAGVRVYAEDSTNLLSSTSVRTTTVNDMASNPTAYLGQIEVVGVVAAVKTGQGFTIVDKREYAACGLSCVNEPDTRKIPVRWSGISPNLAQTVQITGVLEKSAAGFVFSAKTVTEPVKE